jgi:hypothetical protein
VVNYLQPRIDSPLRADNYAIDLPVDTSIENLRQIIDSLREVNSPPDWDNQQSAADLLKFGNLLPAHLLRELILARIADVQGARAILRSPIRVIECD